MIEGKILYLRQVQKEDVSYFLPWYNDQSVTQYIYNYLPVSEIYEEEWIKNISLNRKDTDVFFTVVDKNNNTPIGSCGLHKICFKDRTAEISLVIGNKDYWKKGYGYESLSLLMKYGFNQLNLNRIYSGSYDFNVGSIKLLEKLGFKKEGRQRQAVYKNGKYCDIILFGYLKKYQKIDLNL